MSTLLLALLACYVGGIVLPPCVPGHPRLQNILAHSLACASGLLGVALGVAGLVAPQPLIASVSSTIPYLSFAIRLDPLAAFFVLTISLVGLAASLFALGYVAELGLLLANPLTQVAWRPPHACAAVDPRQMTTRGLTTLISASSHGKQALISMAFGFL